MKRLLGFFLLISTFLMLICQAANSAPISILPSSGTPAFSYANSNPIEMGLKFRSDVNGNGTGVRFFKAAGATGPLGYYGGFAVNIHSDNYYNWSYDGSDQVVASAQANSVPVVSAKQMLDWLDGRNRSSFQSIVWDGTKLGFTVAADPLARNIHAMLLVSFGNNSFIAITNNTNPVTYTVQTIKGVNYAFFPVTSGSYNATY